MATEPTRRGSLHYIGPVAGLLLFAGALWILRHELREYHYHEVVQHVRDLSSHKVLLAILLTILSYWVLTIYDWIALRYIRHPLGYPRTALASFLGYVFSHNLGLNALVSGATRYRLYSVWGLSALEVASIVVFCGLTFWIGFCAVAGVVFVFAPMAFPGTFHLPFASVRPLGFLCLAFVLAYFLGAAFWRKPLRIRRWEFRWPSIPIAAGQIAVSSLDWLVASCVFFVLLPSSTDLSLLTVLEVFTLAQLAGMLSHVPAGVGVFETLCVLMLSPLLPPPVILGALVVYRLIYYVLPLIVGLVALPIFEVLRRRERLRGAWEALAPWLPAVVPNAFAAALLVGGVVLLLSGATPAAGHRLPRLAHVVPLPLIELSHFAGSVAGIGLILVARGLQRRLDGAYVMAILFLAGGAVVSILKGLDYEEAILLCVLLAALIPSHRYFFRKSSLLNERFTPGWIMTIAIAAGASVWIGLFSYKHVEYSDELWWHFSLAGHAPRFLRATAGALVALVLFSIVKLLRPVSPRQLPVASDDLEAVDRIVRACRHTYANLAFLGDKRFLFNDATDGFIMYGIEGRSWVAMGDPVAPEESRMDLIWRFRELCDRHGGWTVFYEVDDGNLPLYLNAGLTLHKIGEEARVPLTEFSLEDRQRKELRQSRRRSEREGCSFSVLDPDAACERVADMRRISDEWLQSKNTREKSFSLGSFREDYLARFPIAAVEQGGRLIAFANIWVGANKEELSPDLMRYAAGAPKGVMEYLFIGMMLWGSQQGYRWFNLGMAPLSGLENRALAPSWNRLGALLFRYGEHFYNFQGLRNYKDKFDPVWEPRYLAIPAGALIPRVLMNIASLTAGGLKGALAK
jgi:phosphatidylglycerol lysyltransferase